MPRKLNCQEEDKLISAWKDNKEDWKEAKEGDDLEEFHFCKGFNRALEFVMGEFGVNYTPYELNEY